VLAKLITVRKFSKMFLLYLFSLKKKKLKNEYDMLESDKKK